MNSLKKDCGFFFLALFLAAISPLILLAALVSLVAWPIERFLAKRRHRRFVARHDGAAFLVCSRRRGWEPYLRNNLTPATPEVVPLWREEIGRDRRDWYALTWPIPYPLPKIPFLAVVAGGQVVFESLNQPLQHLKRRARRSHEAGAAGREIVLEAVERLRRGVDQ